MSRPSTNGFGFMNMFPFVKLPEEEVIEKVIQEFASGAIECNSIARERRGSVGKLDRAER